MARTVREEMEQVAKNHRLREAERKLSPVGLLIEVGSFLLGLIPLGIAVATGHLSPIIVGLIVVVVIVVLVVLELRRLHRRRYVRLRHKGQEHVLKVPKKPGEHVEYLLPNGDRIVLRNPHDYERKED